MGDLSYVVTAKFDDGLYRIENDEWVAIERWYRPKIVDPRTAFSLGPLETHKIDQKEHKMDLFKRFLPVFTTVFGGVTLGILVMVGIFAGTLRIQAAFGTNAAIVAMFITIAAGGAAIVAWIDSGTPR